ncbi:MAG TPA: excinuclease ABC subunit UvrC [Desulfobacteraceae bacterium]|nr:excinuclease ABC subunit UvrC [Desulfobacteraceae bacterium]HPJ67079.1 excinuclease ABC subunit UvrC [Desulfobacteraceae bacterium]HPQ29034.1 excinuclease ABC subunit UvrC [Desulfobacteraceae bacterium]
MTDSHFQNELNPDILRKALPDEPGVYLFKEHSGRVIYVGKAKSLRKRVLSYFRASGDISRKTYLMMKKACGLDFVITATEQEAFILESNFIKEYMPRYNIILRDDKQYPCLRLDIKESYPRLRVVRKIKKDGALYFGPFSSAYSVRSTLRVIDRVFQLRKCKNSRLPKRTRPCLNYQMGRCLGPCTNSVTISDYNHIVDQVRLFLEGRNNELIDRLKKDMSVASDQLDFEQAARIRDQITSIKNTIEKQHVVSQRLDDKDIIGLALKEDLCILVILFLRKGYIVGSRNYTFKGISESASQVIESFLKQYYSRGIFIPKEILISDNIEDLVPLTKWLCELAGKNVVIKKPLRGNKLQLINMAQKNASNLISGHLPPQKEDTIQMMKSVLKLRIVPRHIEGLDISNLGGDMAVGTIVSFIDGEPHRSGYRNYRIRSVEGINDYGMMAELVQRRISSGNLPDLFLVDGGKGHLSSVENALVRRDPEKVPAVVSIAKPDESRQETCDRLYIPGRKNPVTLRPDHPVLLMLMQIRDAAHGRAIAYHRMLRSKGLIKSELDAIPGIGKKRKKILLTYFNDMNMISSATIGELTQIPGISISLAEKIYLFFRAGNE